MIKGVHTMFYSSGVQVQLYQLHYSKPSRR